ncbi:NADH-quinone oxidoreductase subunit G [Prosthecobacter fusiformis]|uniref:NADH-quinone oxidoreductase subunit G n=1 Tax=Prosthecobacter fusiformis TaxID=48464 RepID=A0A4R7S3Y6_9BACT|nr:molybdopterin-dependent oxidoreductase [Prosthecobacter fusiformis]TDU73014.1 NADH-quinone oxidoreductase subunit G [Prosthecobacter fusiformis]
MSAPAAAASPTAPPPVDLVNVQIDGVWLKFPKGTRMIEACKQAKKEVPHYCYHPKLSSPGNCRMCLVEMGMPPRPAPGQEAEKDEHGMPKIGWMPRPVIACANTVAEGMGIRTESVLTQECRKGVMEFLLINHPLDCPICDQAGECRLQEFSVEHGKGESRFRENKVKKPKNVDIGPRVRLDDERCIMCSRCIRFTAEIADDPVLGFTERGSHTTLAVHPGKRLENNYSLNTVDICPVGALTSNDFRFQQRVWFLSETNSICTGCGRGCNMEIGARGDTIYRQTPRDNNDVNSSWMCDRGRLDFHFVNSEYRLTDPLLKSGGKHEISTWKKTIQAVAAGLSGIKGDEIAIIASARMTNEELFFVRQLARVLGTENVDVIPRIGEGDNYLSAADKNANTLGVRQILEIEPGSRIAGITELMSRGRLRAVLALGENLLKVGFERRDLEKIGFLTTLHVLANATAELSHAVLPGTSYAETRGSMINVTGRLQRLNKAVNPPGNARDTWEILRDLVVACGGSNGLYSAEDVFKCLANDIPAFNGLTFAKIGDQGIPLIETDEKIPLLEREKERKAKGIIVG